GICKLKSNKPPEVKGFQRQSCLFFYFPEKALFRTFPFFKMAAYTDPLIFIYVVFLHNTVQHQIAVILFNIAKGGHYRLFLHFSISLLLFISSLRDFCTFFLVTSTIFKGVISTTEALTGSSFRQP